jgi:choline transport protein
MYCGFLGFPFAIAIITGPKYLPAFQIFGAAFNVLSGIVWAIVFMVLAPKTSSKFVFTEFINTSGWTSNGWVFILSFYVPIYGLYGTDGVMHCKLILCPYWPT